MNFKQILLVVLCIAIYGCHENIKCDNSLFYPYWSEWTEGRLISIVDDSLAVLSAQKYKTECKNDEENLVGSRVGLSLVNYRVKQKPLLVDIYSHNSKEVSNNIEIAGNYFKDSSVLVIEELYDKVFGFWKIGTSSVKFNKYNYLGYSLNSASPWIDGNVLLKKRTDTTWQTAVLNTKTGKIEQYDSPKGHEWLSGCKDVSSIENKITCVKANRETESVELIVDGNITDTTSLFFDSYGLYNIIFYGNYIIRSDEYLDKIYKIDIKNFKFDNIFTPIWINRRHSPPRFYKDNKNSDDFLEYAYEDLFGWQND